MEQPVKTLRALRVPLFIRFARGSIRVQCQKRLIGDGRPDRYVT